MARRLEEWTEILRADSGPRGFDDMPEAMAACSDMEQRVAFLRAFRDAIARKHPDKIALRLVGDNIDYIASEYSLPPRSWSKAVEIAFPCRKPTADEISAGVNWEKGGFGSSIPDLVVQMTADANASGEQKRCEMNEVFYVANPGDTADDVYAHAAVSSMIYRIKMHARRNIAKKVAGLVEDILERMDKDDR